MTTPAPKRTRRTHGLSPLTKAVRGLLRPTVMITVNVSGNVTTERDLINAIQKGLNARARNNPPSHWQTGVVKPGKPS